MINFITKQLESASVGEKLKTLREKSNIDLNDLAKKIKIRAIYLQRLETNDYEHLPADVYVEGFIKKYAQILDVDAQSLIDEYKNEQKRIKKIIQSAPPSLKMPKFVLAPGNVRTGLFFLVILIIGGYFFYQMIFLFRPPRLILLSPETDIIVKENKIQFIGQAGPDINLTINNQEAYIDKEGNFKEEIILQKGLNIIEITAKNRFDKTASVVRKIIKE